MRCCNFTDHVILREEQCRISFTAPKAGEMLLKLKDLTGFLLDFTFKTNEHGLLLGAVGPVGLVQDESTGEPHMRFFPSIFMLSDAEDESAHQLLVSLFLNTAESIEMKITDDNQNQFLAL